MKRVNIFLLVVAAACGLQVHGAYPGNSNFRNVASGFAAQNRTDWVTNVTVVTTPKVINANDITPAISSPIDWDTCPGRITLSPGVTYIPAILTKDGGWPTNIVCHFVRIDTHTPGLRFTGTERCAGWGDPMPEPEAKSSRYESGYYPKRTVREKTTDFLARNRGSKSKGGKERDAVLAWNGTAWLPWTNPTTNLWACPYSPLYSDGIQISDVGTGGVSIPSGASAPNAVFVNLKTGVTGVVVDLLQGWVDENMIWCTAPAFACRLVSVGTAVLHLKSSTAFDPRTALGSSADLRYVYLFVCDGRMGPTWSGGCDTPTLSTLLVAMGSWEAMNLDGGGSSTLCAWDAANNRPTVLNRPGSSWSTSSLRDNGSNIAIYYKEPEAILGAYPYDDLDTLIDEVVGGRSQRLMTEVNVLADATFTAEHPYLPVNGFTFCSTNQNTASIGWEAGLTPQVAPNCMVTFRNIRFRDMQAPLTIPAGSKAVFNGVSGISEISSADANGIVVAGSVPAGLRVSCAAASNVGDVFGTSSLSLADARAEAQKIGCATDASLVADAFEDGGTVKLRWSKIVTFGTVTGKMSDTSHGIVNVNVDSCSSEYATGYKLKFTVISEDGLRTATKVIDFAGAGAYSFDTAETSDPTICGSGYGFDFTVELVDAGGTHVLNSEVVSGSMGIGVAKDWFSASAADDSATGGAWTQKPAIEAGRYVVAGGVDLDFAATEAKGGKVRFETDFTSGGFISDAFASQQLAAIKASGTTPHGACFLVRGADGEPAWRALVSDNGEPAFVALNGPAALNTPIKVFLDVDWSSGAARVRYSVKVGDGAETVLADAAGNTWLPGASAANAAAGRVVASGTGSVGSLVGKYFARILAGGYAAWIDEKGITGEPDDTATNGIPNIVRYAFDIGPEKGPAEMGDPILQVVFDANGNPAVLSRDLATGRDDIAFDILATENLSNWNSPVPMEKFSDGLWKPEASESGGYVFPSKMFFKYKIEIK